MGKPEVLLNEFAIAPAGDGALAPSVSSPSGPAGDPQRGPHARDEGLPSASQYRTLVRGRQTGAQPPLKATGRSVTLPGERGTRSFPPGAGEQGAAGSRARDQEKTDSAVAPRGTGAQARGVSF